jgi:hypothetical protein
MGQEVTYTVLRSNVKALRPGDPYFTISNGVVVTSRAGFEISKNCPAEYKSIFITAINAGWIKPVAHVTEEEYMVMQLSN